ncbi:MAG TPA: hypothetical protein VHM20_03065, partial [Gammaproteobacteria bacterium]|nr:hypothetical protein [Gammaproteobacteria bacterium]
WALLGLSLVFGLVATGYRYIQSQEIQEKLAANNQMREPAPVIDREEYKKDIELKKKELLGLRDRLFFYEQMGYPMPASLNGPDLTLEYKKETFGQKLTNFGLGVRNHPLMDAWDWQMTGIFFTRIVIPTVSAALFWSITSVAVLASLSNPVTVALVFALGTVYTIAKWYEKKKQNAEKELIDLPKEKADLANQISLANLALQYNEKKCDLDMASKKSREKNNVVDISSSKNRLFSLPPATYAAKDNTSEVQENDLLGSPNLCYASS